MSRQNSLNQIAKKYAGVSILKGNELLLPPASIFPMLDDLEAADIPIAGLTAWVKVTLQDGSIGIAEALEYFHNMVDELFEPEKANAETFNHARSHVNEIMNQVGYISVDLIVPLSWGYPAF
jgi:hypothetical protein